MSRQQTSQNAFGRYIAWGRNMDLLKQLCCSMGKRKNLKMKAICKDWLAASGYLHRFMFAASWESQQKTAEQEPPHRICILRGGLFVFIPNSISAPVCRVLWWGRCVYSRLVVDSRCNSFLAARWGIAATHLNIPLWNTSKLRAKLFAFVVCLGKVDNAGRSA